MRDIEFRNYQPERDKFNRANPQLRLGDLPPRFEGEPVLSILMSANDFRASQIARTLEAYARQTYRHFEVLICDNGSAIPLVPVVEQFEPYLQVRSVRLERGEFLACPTTGLKALLPLAQGSIIAIQQPEVMPKPDVAAYLALAHTANMPDIHRYKISSSRASMLGRPTWVNLKPAPLSERITLALDGIDWHSDMTAIDQQPNFIWNGQNFASLGIDDIQARREFPYWFAASAPRDANLWEDMPTFKGHASLDFWLLNYRRENEYVDLTPHAILCYHQAHVRTSIMPDGEMQSSLVGPAALDLPEMDIEELREWLKSYPAQRMSDSDNMDKLWLLLQRARQRDQRHRTREGYEPRVERPPDDGMPVGEGMSVRVRRIKESQQ